MKFLSGKTFMTFKPFNFTCLPVAAMRIPLNTRLASDELPMNPGSLAIVLSVIVLLHR
jgi:hypothetical protein